MLGNSAAPRLQLLYGTDDKPEKDQLIEFGAAHGLLGENPKFLCFLKDLRRFERFSHIVLLEGETGTGKELAARALHGRRAGSFVAVNCGSLGGEMGRLEFMGYKAKSFTNSGQTDRKGLFVQAAKGTLLLDEVQLLDMATQQHLLRTLQNKTVLPIGEAQEVNVSTTRIVVASNANLSSMVGNGSFRGDLYHRLRVLVLRIPPLRDRVDDIPLLAQCFVDKHRNDFNSQVTGISPGALTVLQQHDWPGNVRELEHVIMGVLARKENGQVIEVGDLTALTSFGEALSQVENPFLLVHEFDKAPTFAEAYEVVERFALNLAWQQGKWFEIE